MTYANTGRASPFCGSTDMLRFKDFSHIILSGIGDLFIVRTSRNVIGESERASLKFVVNHLEIDVIVVMGHTDCRATKAFVREKREQGHLQAIRDSLTKRTRGRRSYENSSFRQNKLLCIG